jgi:DNA-binding transcriptional ArsR family regulator
MRTLRVDVPKARDRLAVLDVIHDAVRRQIIRLLGPGPLNVTALCQATGKRQQAMSHHLTICKLRGLVRVQRRGKSNYYRLAGPGRDALAVIELLEGPGDGDRTDGRGEGHLGG